jgi:hypothetical protein
MLAVGTSPRQERQQRPQADHVQVNAEYGSFRDSGGFYVPTVLMCPASCRNHGSI